MGKEGLGRLHLKVVWDKDAANSFAHIYREPVQLSLPLDKNQEQLIFSSESILTGRWLENLLSYLQPNYLIDFRRCPRFDFFGYSRKRAFSDFEKWNTNYLCLSSEESLEDVREQAHRLFLKMTSGANSILGPIVAIVEREEDIEKILPELPKPKSKKGEWDISVEGFECQSFPGVKG